MRDNTGNDLPDTYLEQIYFLALAARIWMGQNPKVEASLRFKGPQETMVIGTVPDAITAGFLEVNEGGRALLEAIGALTEGEKMPTVFMVRMALEHMDIIMKEEDDK